MKLKINLLVLLLSGFFTASAQNWGGGVDDDDIHFGFTFQYVGSEYKILKTADWRAPFFDPELGPDSFTLRSVSSKSSPGFGIGFVVNKRISENADLRFTPVLVFNDRILSYQYTNPNMDVEKKTSATMVEFPLGFKLKSDRRNNFRAYVIGGGKYSVDISSKKKSNNDLVTDPAEKLVNNKRSFLSYEAGLGFDLYFEYFKMSPEIKLSYSLNSVLKDEPLHRYSTPIDKLMLRHVTFSLFFE
ncbi:type IX secretion/gliding motility protein PorT/SprT [Pedobacter sp. GR22-6]|uniref:type IX secretion/gliding motility protein PorT/SprT n=1 Tax=Pedobacter sp. GR22-6 TaxID=3127957 RepID=UPI00307E4D3F